MVWDSLPEPLCDLCRKWREKLWSSEEWTVHPEQPDPGEAGGVRVYSDSAPFGAYLKPTKNKRDETPRAANEKICADLANDIPLPVPPALLYFRRDVVTDPAHTVLSLWLADEIWRVKDLRALSDPPWDLAGPALARGSGIIAFDAWVGNVDRNNERNTIFFERDDGNVQVAFIDFSYSLDKDRRWIDDSDGNADVDFPNLLPELRDHASEDRLLSAIEAIEDLSEEDIRDAVSRIPDRFLDQSRRETVVQTLLERAENLRSSLADEISL